MAIGAWLVLTASGALSSQTLEEARQLHLDGELDGALAAYGELIDAGGRVAPSDRATAYSNSCVIYMNRGQFPAALEACEAALELGRELDDRRVLGRILNNLGLVLQYLGRLEEARGRFEEALAINRRREDFQAQVINLANLGVLAVSAGEYGRGLALHGAAADLAVAHADEAWSERQRVVAELNRGGILEGIGSYDEALEAYRRAMKGEDQLDARGRAVLRMNLGVVYRNLGDPVLAIEAFEAAIEAFTEVQDRAGEANAWLNLGMANHLNLEDLDRAESAIGEALRLARASSDLRGELLGSIALGHLRLDQGELAGARTAFEACVQLADASESLEGRWSALDGLARAAAAEDDLQGARDLYLEAIGQIEQDRAGLSESSLRSHYLQDRRAVFGAAVDLLSRLDRRSPGQGFAEEALLVAQRAKARDLIDVLGAGFGPTDLPTVEEIVSGAAEGLTLEYFVGDEELHLWAVTGSGVEMIHLGPYRPILEAVAALYEGLASGGTIDRDAVSALSESLLGPVEEGVGSVSRLTVAADGGLFFLPFELLDDPADEASPLLDRVVVSYLPSASSGSIMERRAGGRHPFDLLLANPSLTLAAAAPSAVGEVAGRLNLPPLPAAERELAAIERWLPGEQRSATGERATETLFRRLAADQPRLVHFATHAVARTPSGLGAAILLAPSADDDGLLEPREIAALDCRTELTVLSACRTAMGPSDRTGALATLTGAFLAAGSSAVVATLWEVGDRTTAAFMDQFYYQLGRGLAPAPALRQAKMALRADPQWNRPEVWAAYIVIGEAPPLVEPARWRRPAAALLAVLLLGVAVAWLVARRRGRS